MAGFRDVTFMVSGVELPAEAPKPAKPKRLKVHTDDLIALSCKAIAEQYDADNIAPGLVIAHLRGDKSPTGEPTWYVSARRYDKLSDASGPISETLVRVYNSDLDEAIRLVAIELVSPTEHTRALEKALA